MALSNFFSEVMAGRGMDAVNKEASRVGVGAKKEINRLGTKATGALRYGEKVAGSVSRFGDKVSQTANSIGAFTGPIAMATGAIPLVGNIASGVNAGVNAIGRGGQLLSSSAKESEKIMKTGQGLIRSGRSLMEAKSGGDVVATARDIARTGRQQYKSSKSMFDKIR